MIYLSDIEAKKILNLINSGNKNIISSIDLNISKTNFVVEDNFIVSGELRIPLESVVEISESNERIFLIEDKNIIPLEISGDNYFKLTPSEWGIPTVQISGIKMHRTKNIDPWQDTLNKVHRIVRKNDFVLDTCSGLGYTAIEAINMGASKVFSIEREYRVHKLLRLNPWSQKFIQDENIFKIIGDSSIQVHLFKDELFNAIIHDPPRFSIAGDLYSGEFYRTLHRILKRNGKLFHYIGKPDSAFGKKMFKSIKKRLEDSGFAVKIEEKRYGITGRKIN